ncbi:hypothetical protein D3C75_1114210 [compost metagenome]
MWLLRKRYFSDPIYDVGRGGWNACREFELVPFNMTIEPATLSNDFTCSGIDALRCAYRYRQPLVCRPIEAMSKELLNPNV